MIRFGYNMPPPHSELGAGSVYSSTAADVNRLQPASRPSASGSLAPQGPTTLNDPSQGMQRSGSSSARIGATLYQADRDTGFQPTQNVVSSAAYPATDVDAYGGGGTLPNALSFQNEIVYNDSPPRSSVYLDSGSGDRSALPRDIGSGNYRGELRLTGSGLGGSRQTLNR